MRKLEKQEKVINLIEAVDIYEKSMQADQKAANTMKNYISTQKDFINFCASKNVDVYNVKESAFKILIHEYLMAKIEYSNSKLNENVKYATSSTNNKRCSLRNLIKKLHILGKIENDFSNGIVNLKLDKGEPKRVLSHDELERVSKILTEDIENANKGQMFIRVRNKYMFWFFVLTGVRVSELTRVKWTDIDKKRNEILIPKAKGKRTRTIDMLGELKLLLYDYKEYLEKIKEYGYNIESPYVFTKYREPEKPMNNKTAYYVITDIMKRAGINTDESENNISPHNLRHTFASYAIDKNVNPAYLARQLGHSSPDVMYKVYTHEIDQKQRDKEREKIEQAFSSIKK